jgi:hypothetical protein
MRRSIIAVVVVMSLASPATASSSVTLFRQHGLAAQAEFRSTEGSVETVFFVNADTESVAGGPGAPARFSQAGASLGFFDTETGAGVVRACAPTGSSPPIPELPPGALSISPNLMDARLQAEFDCDGLPVAVDLTWATGGVSLAGGFSVISRLPELFFNAAFQNVFALEGTASGVVTDGSTNFTPVPSDRAPVFRFGTAQVVIG